MNETIINVPDEVFAPLEELVLVNIPDLIQEPEEEFQQITEYALSKNAELYERLASCVI